MTRKLAHIEKILKIEPIEEADKIEVATILGWSCVVKKDEFKVGDMIVFIEPDAILPEKPIFEFMRPRKFRVKTCKLRGVISQGLVFPLHILPNGFKIKEGADCTKSLSITKYGPQETKKVKIKLSWRKNKWRYFIWKIKSFLRKIGIIKSYKKTWPYFLKKTDEERCQNLSDRFFNGMKSELIYISEKIDGQSVTFFKHKRNFGICSRNVELHEKIATTNQKIYFDMAKKYDLENKIPSGFAIQCEQYGKGIQGNKYHLDEVKLACFNVYDIINKKYLSLAEFMCFCTTINIPTVPILKYYTTLDNIVSEVTAKELLTYSKGNSVLNKDVKREGIVIRSIKEKIIYRLGRFSFKAINPEFLLKYEKVK